MAYHRLGGLNNINLLSHSPRGRKSKIKVLAGLGFWLAHKLGFLQTELSTCCVPCALLVPGTAGNAESGFLPWVRKSLQELLSASVTCKPPQTTGRVRAPWRTLISSRQGTPSVWDPVPDGLRLQLA